MEKSTPAPPVRPRRRLALARVGLLLTAVVLLGAEGCTSAGDWIHALFFSRELPRYGGEREEEERAQFPLRYASPQPSPQDDDYPLVSLPTFGPSSQTGDEDSILRDLYPERYASPSPSPAVRRTKTIQAIPYEGTFIAESEVKQSFGTECDREAHWHAAQGGTATTIEGKTVPDPNPRSCGFGKVKYNPLRPVHVPAD